MPRAAAAKGRTPITPLRLGPGTVAEIDWLAARLGVGTRAAAVRAAVRRVALAEGYAPAANGRKKNPKKS